jgi:ADP-heptose:LPS heptosyltransferase
LVQTEFSPAIEAHPDLDGVLCFPRSRLRGLWKRPDRWNEAIDFLRSIRRGGFDLVLDCQGLARSGLMTRITGASVRIGDRNAREFGWLACTDLVDLPEGTHEVDRMLALAERAGAEPDGNPSLFVPPADAVRWAHRRESLGLEDPWVVLAPATRWLSKAWPAGHWASLGRRLLEERSDLKLVLVGGPSEAHYVGPVAEALRAHHERVVNLCGVTGIGELMAVIEGAELTIASDSAPVHMAVGLGGRYVGLYGPTDHKTVGPWGGVDKCVAAPRASGETFDYRNLNLRDSIMRRIEVGAVVERTLAALGVHA